MWKKTRNRKKYDVFERNEGLRKNVTGKEQKRVPTCMSVCEVSLSCLRNGSDNYKNTKPVKIQVADLVKGFIIIRF